LRISSLSGEQWSGGKYARILSTERSEKAMERSTLAMKRRVDIKAILANHEEHQKLILGVRRFCCALEGMMHDKNCVCDQEMPMQLARGDDNYGD